ncbi:MAG: NEL-type E3 ubiquitin ligase domain-containing protein [Chlamydiales bacterium]
MEERIYYSTVKKITIKDNRLSKLPRSIIKFTNLKSIDLNNNRFTTIPSEIYNFKNLKKLCIKNNFISYVSMQIGRLKRLEEIHLSKNKIEHIHRRLFSLKQLHTLNLSENKLKTIPKWINNLHNLKSLNVSFNKLFDIPPEIFGKNLEYLDLSNNHIDVIPRAIKNSSKLLDINFDSNEIVNIPDEVGDLCYLTGVYLNDNETLRGFSDNLYNLLPSCTVEIDNSGISLSTLSEIQSKSAQMNYNGPAFEFSMAAAEERIEDRLIGSLYVHTTRNPPRAFKNLRSMSDHLEMWLNRLNWMADFQDDSTNFTLPEAIIDCIEYAEVNSEYYKLFESIIQGATATCGDGIALSIIDIGIAKEVLTFIESKQIVELSHFLLGSAFPRQILQKIAGQKITFLKLEAKQKDINNFSIDDVEVYLAYPILLKERLKLSININSMMTESAATGVTQKDLEIAALEVEKQQADKQACAEFLVNNTYWIELIKQLHPEEYEAINEQSIEMMDESEEAAEKYRRNSLIALSGINL